MMKWIRIMISLGLGILAAVGFVYVSQRVELDSAAPYTYDPSGNLYLLTGAPALLKVTPEGLMEWSISLPRTREDGGGIRYGTVVSDRSGSVYVTRQDFRQQVNALGRREEVTLGESVLAFHGDGEEQNPVFTADLTKLAQYSTADYILNLRAHGDSLLALCCLQGQYEIVRIEPYEEREPKRLSAFFLEQDPEELQDCTPLSDGGMVYTTGTEGLYYVNSQGERKQLRSKADAGGLVGRLSGDETDSIYFTELESGAYLRMDPKFGSVDQVFSSISTVDAGVALGQMRQVRALGDGAWCALSLEGERPFWLRFDSSGNSFRCGAAHRRLCRQEMLAAGAIGAAGAVLAWLLGWTAGWLSRRSRLTSRILIRFLPVFLAALIAASAGVGAVSTAQEKERRQQQMASASRSAAGLISPDQLRGAALRRYSPEEWNGLFEEARRVAEQAKMVSGLETAGLVYYALEGKQCLGVCTTLERDRFYSADCLVPLSQEFSASTARRILDCARTGGNVEFYRDSSLYSSYFQPVLDGNGSIVGLVETRTEGDWTVRAGRVLRPVCYLLAAAAAAALWLVVVVARAFRPLRELRRCMNAIGAGDWNARARIDSQDEFAEIGDSFNQMTERLSRYISGMVRLNSEYIKFIPRELFQFVGKSRVTELELGDMRVAQASILHVKFLSGDAPESSEQRFAEMNQCFDPIFQVVNRNKGVIQRLDGTGITALFPGRAQDALNAAISLKEMLAKGIGTLHVSILIASDRTLVGVAGNENRQTITALSPTIRNAYAIQALMEEMGTRYVLTRQAMEQIAGDVYFNCREIGGGAAGQETLYEFLDGMEPYDKKLYLATKEEFERGVREFQAGRYPEARKHFAGVLQVNERDRTAMYYLLHCNRTGEVRALES